MKNLMSILVALLLTACGAGETGATSPKQDIDSSDLVAAEGFDFRTNGQKSFIFTNSAVGNGAYTVYHKRAFTDENGIITADPLTRVTSVRSSSQTELDIMVNNSWSELIVTWVSETASIPEVTRAISLDNSETSYSVSF